MVKHGGVVVVSVVVVLGGRGSGCARVEGIFEFGHEGRGGGLLREGGGGGQESGATEGGVGLEVRRRGKVLAEERRTQGQVISDDGGRGQLGGPLGLLVRVREVLRLSQETRVVSKVLALLLLLLMVLTINEESLGQDAGGSLS